MTWLYSCWTRRELPMTTRDTGVIERAANADGPFGAALFDAIADGPARAAGWTLSLSLGLRPKEIVHVANKVFGDHDAAGGLDSLASWSFVERRFEGDGLWVIAAPFAPWVRRQFEKADEGRFRLAHTVLLELERGRRDVDLEDPAWMSEVRSAYYEAGIDQESSVHRFIDVFEGAPWGRRHPYRWWVSELALRQAPLLTDHQRELRFFRGFQEYARKDYGPARTLFVDVVRGETADPYQAVSLHLLGVIGRRRRQPRWEAEVVTAEGEELRAPRQLFEEAIELSQELDLWENEVMARNSLVWELVSQAKATDADRQGLHTLAASLAELNEERTRGNPLSQLHLRCLRTTAITTWMALADGHQPVDLSTEVVSQIFSELEGAGSASRDRGDVANVTLAVLDLLRIAAHPGIPVEEALAVVERLLNRPWPEVVGRPDIDRMLRALRKLRRRTSAGIDFDDLVAKVAALGAEDAHGKVVVETIGW